MILNRRYINNTVENNIKSKSPAKCHSNGIYVRVILQVEDEDFSCRLYRKSTHWNEVEHGKNNKIRYLVYIKNICKSTLFFYILSLHLVYYNIGDIA